MKLHFNFRGNFRWYLLAFAVPLVCFSASQLLPVIIGGHGSRLSAFTVDNVLSVIFILMGQSAVVSAGLLGEELGWRGYMNRKLEPLVGTLGTCLIGGIIWGLWHCPLIWLIGYEYGTDYIGFPITGMILFCIITVVLGIICDWLYERSQCIWVPSIFHGAFNAAATIPLCITFGGAFMVVVDILSRTFTDSEIPLSAVTGLLGTVIFVVILIIKRRKLNEHKDI